MARSGVLQQQTVDLVEFRHPSLQDFLAAHEVRRTKQFADLMRKLEDSLYQDVFILAVGQAETDDEIQDELLSRLLGAAQRTHRRDLWLLAAAAIADTTARNRDIERAIHEATRRVLPPQNMAQAAELSATAAPFILDLLSESLASGRDLSQNEVAATARVARNHGGVEAYPLLRMLSVHPHTDVRGEVLTGLRYSEDKAEYTREVRDIAPIAGLPRLRTLDIGGTQVADVGPLDRHPTLDHLELEGSRVLDVDPVAHVLHRQYRRERRERG